MTTNQIAYWENQERIRSNMEEERLKARDLSNKERETSNKERETSEQIRANLTNESLRSREIANKEQNLAKEIGQYRDYYGYDPGSRYKSGKTTPYGKLENIKDWIHDYLPTIGNFKITI